jgi:hypothetical protein
MNGFLMGGERADVVGPSDTGEAAAAVAGFGMSTPLSCLLHTFLPSLPGTSHPSMPPLSPLVLGTAQDKSNRLEAERWEAVESMSEMAANLVLFEKERRELERFKLEVQQQRADLEQVWSSG